MNDKIKRYGISIGFIVFIAVCIGTFYIQAAESRYPEFRFVTQQGDENEAKNLLVRGSYHQDQMWHSYRTRLNSDVTISVEGSQYASERSFLELIDPIMWSPDGVKQLVKEHRHFMRGKRAISSFYNDENLLVFANVEMDFMSKGAENFYFDVAVLDKKQKKTWSYEVQLPDSQLYRYINVYNIQVYDDEIIVVTRNQKKDNFSEFHRYTLSLKNENIPKPMDQVIELPQPEANYNLRHIGQSNPLEVSRYNVFYATQTQQVLQNDHTIAAEPNDHTIAAEPVEYTQEIISSQILIYDIQSNQLAEINSQEVLDFIDDPLDAAKMNLKLVGAQLFLTKNSSEGVSVIEYNIPDTKTSLYEVRVDSVEFSEVTTDRIYMVSKNEKGNWGQLLLSIADLQSGEIVYQGSIELSETESNETNAFNLLDIHYISIK